MALEAGFFDLMIFSITINVLVFFTALTSRIFHGTFSTTSVWTGLGQNSQEKQNKMRQLGNRASRSVTRVLQSMLAPAFMVFLIFESSLTVDPFKIRSMVAIVFFNCQLGFFCFEFLVPFLDKNKPFSGYPEILHHAVSITMYLGILLTRENGLLGMIGVFIIADGFMQEIIALCQFFPHRKTSVMYIILLFLYAVSLGTFRIILPVVAVAVSFVYWPTQVNQMYTISIGIFFFSLVFIAGYQGWFYINRMLFIHEEFKKAVRKEQSSSSDSSTATSCATKRLKGASTRAGVQNDYVFDMTEATSLDEISKTETIRTIAGSVLGISKNRKDPDNEPTHFFV